MNIPNKLVRCSTREAIESLAERLELPFDDSMQDWEWEVADPNRIDEFLHLYEQGSLTDDERFALMETIIQSFEDLTHRPESDPRWGTVLDTLSLNSDLHISTIWYWASLEVKDLSDTWDVAASVRELLYGTTQYLVESGSRKVLTSGPLTTGHTDLPAG